MPIVDGSRPIVDFAWLDPVDGLQMFTVSLFDDHFASWTIPVTQVEERRGHVQSAGHARGFARHLCPIGPRRRGCHVGLATQRTVTNWIF
eukprot:s130_g39.t1